MFYGSVVGLYVLFRVGSFTNIGDVVTDTPGYEKVAAASLWSSHFWAGRRGLTIPLFFKIFETTESRIVAQLVFSIVAWIIFAASLARSMRTPLVGRIAFAVALAFSLTTEVVLWDTLLLSESLTFALLALLLAAWLQLLRSPSKLWTALVLIIAALWVFARDTNAYLLLIYGVFAVLALPWATHRRLTAALAIGCVTLFALDYGSANVGKRWELPLENVVQERVLPYPTIRSYFVNRGLRPATNWPDSKWMTTRAKHVYADYLIANPAYTLFQPFHGRQHALYSTSSNIDSLVDPTIAPYNDNAGHRFLPLPSALERLLFPRGVAIVAALVAAVLAATAIAWRTVRATRIWLVPITILVSTYPHFLVVWHQSGYEVDRHALEAALLLRLAIGMLGLLVLDSVVLLRHRARSVDHRGGPGS